MSCKSAIYVENTSSFSAAFVAGSLVQTVPLGSTLRRFGNCIRQTGNGVRIGDGYYEVVASVTVQGTTAGTYQVQLLNDGVAVPGASGTLTLTAAGFGVVSFPAIVRNCGQCCSSTLTLAISGAAATTANVVNVAMTVERL